MPGLCIIVHYKSNCNNSTTKSCKNYGQ